jgi:hypothetical protein
LTHDTNDRGRRREYKEGHIVLPGVRLNYIIVAEFNIGKSALFILNFKRPPGSITLALGTTYHL